MVYLLKRVIFHGELLNNQMVGGGWYFFDSGRVFDNWTGCISYILYVVFVVPNCDPNFQIKEQSMVWAWVQIKPRETIGFPYFFWYVY